MNLPFVLNYKNNRVRLIVVEISNVDPSIILNRITDGFFALDNNWNFTYVNEEASRLLARRSEELIGRKVWYEFPAAVELLFYEMYHKAVSEQEAVTFDAFFPPLNTWFDVRAYPSEDGLSVFFKDITENKKVLSQNEQHYKSLFEQNPDAVYSLDLHGNYLSVNEAMVRTMGYSEEEFLSMSYIPIIPEEDIEMTTSHFQNATKGITQHYETKVVHKDGRVLHIRVTNIPIVVDEEIVGVYGIARDITKQIETEKLLLRSEKLSAVGQLSASIAHEIRNPLTSIKGFIQLLKTTMKDVPEYLDIVSEEVTRIEDITGELLVLAKPEKLHYNFEDFERIIDQVVVLLNSQALINKVEIKTDVQHIPHIYCVQPQIKQVLINIIKNSIEAMPDGGEVKVRAEQINETQIKISVSDEGCGIPEEILELIGLPFYTTKDKGTGLGMMTTINIVEAHGGNLDISSTTGQGTTVTIILPIK